MKLDESLHILDRMLDPLTQDLSGGAARQLLDLRADQATQERLEMLASKAEEDELSPEERSEYAAYVEALNVIGVLQAKARKALERPSAA